MRASSYLEDESGEMRGKTETGTVINGRSVPQKVNVLNLEEEVSSEELSSALREVLDSYEERGWETGIDDEVTETQFYVSKDYSLMSKINIFSPSRYCLAVVVPDEVESVSEISIYNDSRYGRRRADVHDEMIDDFTSEIVEAL